MFTSNFRPWVPPVQTVNRFPLSTSFGLPQEATNQKRYTHDDVPLEVLKKFPQLQHIQKAKPQPQVQQQQSEQPQQQQPEENNEAPPQEQEQQQQEVVVAEPEQVQNQAQQQSSQQPQIFTDENVPEEIKKKFPFFHGQSAVNKRVISTTPTSFARGPFFTRPITQSIITRVEPSPLVFAQPKVSQPVVQNNSEEVQEKAPEEVNQAENQQQQQQAEAPGIKKYTQEDVPEEIKQKFPGLNRILGKPVPAPVFRSFAPVSRSFVGSPGKLCQSIVIRK